METNTQDRSDGALEEIQRFGELYAYDVTYLEELARSAPAGFRAFRSAMGLSQRRGALGPEAHAVATLAVLGAEDCGACTQLNLRMAVEGGVSRELLGTLLEDPARLPEPLWDVYCHARDVARGAAPDAERVALLRWTLGAEAFGELATAIVAARLYPGLKRALGHGTSCRRPTLAF